MSIDENQKITYIIGHKNPDTDSCVSSTAYAKLKELLGGKNYIAARAGSLSPQTQYVFDRFNIAYPEYVPDLVPKVAYYMTRKSPQVRYDVAVWDAVNLMNKTPSRALPVVDNNGDYCALLHDSVFAKNVLSVLNPKEKILFPTTISLITHTLNAQPILTFDEHKEFKACVLVGASNVETFTKTLASHNSEDIVVIASDRTQIQQAAINAHVRLLVITSLYTFDKELREKANANHVSVIISPYGTSSTAMLVAYPTSVLVMADKTIKAIHEKDTVDSVRALLQKSPCRALPVVAQNTQKVIGLISENDLLREPNIELILVDHNNTYQAVDGIEHYHIQEIIDHHHLGNLSTTYPLTFINKPVGSTATLITCLYREYKVAIPKDIAAILLCGILCDTLSFMSTTTTDEDKIIARYLCDITGLDAHTLGQEVLDAGTHISGRTAAELIKQDMKEYTFQDICYTVSQIEVGSAKEALQRKAELLKELQAQRHIHNASFTALLITDITKLSSLLLLNTSENFSVIFNFPLIEDNVYYLKDIVSRKKQLIPLLTQMLSTKI